MNLSDCLASGRVFVIAEIGSNHDGCFEQALELMDVAVRAGADAVKFQSFLADHLVQRDSPDHALLKRIEMPREWYPKLQRAAMDRDLVFFSTATNDITLAWLEDVGVSVYKIASPNLTHLPLIRRTARLGKPVIMSTGMAGWLEIDEAVRTFRAAGNEQLALMHCVSEYPARPEGVNLRFIQTLANAYDYPIGFSDHTLASGTSVAAVALGARIIEKHLTGSRAGGGPDHHYSLEPLEFTSMVENIRVVEKALGRSSKTVSAREASTAASAWRTLHAARDLPGGHDLSTDDLAVVRPGDGLHPRYLDVVGGMTLRRPIAKGQALTWWHFKEEGD